MKRGKAAACLLGAWTAASTGLAGDLERLGWLQGNWVGEKDGVLLEERWMGPPGGALLGVHADVAAGRLVFWEFLRIDVQDGTTFYFASPRSAPPTAFELVELGEARVVFENKQHDFPQRILYWLDEDGALHAGIEGPQGGKTVSEEWVFTRIRPASSGSRSPN